MGNGFREIKREKGIWKNKNVENRLLREVKTDSGIEVDFLYTPDDTKEVDYLRDIGFPGQYPYTHGVQPTMYRERIWTMRQYSGLVRLRKQIGDLNIFWGRDRRG